MTAKRAFAAEFLAAEIATAVGRAKARPDERGVQNHEISGPSTRCLVLGNAEQCVGVGPFDRVDDVNEDFDVILALTADRPALELLMARSSNPAAPLITCSQDAVPRADFVLSDTSSTSIASALLLVQPLIKRVAALPRIAQGVDRHRLLALTLAYT